MHKDGGGYGWEVHSVFIPTGFEVLPVLNQYEMGCSGKGTTKTGSPSGQEDVAISERNFQPAVV